MRRFTAAGVSALGLKAGWGTTREAPATIELEKCEEGDRVSHAGLTPEERARLGISDRLIRVSVGIESADDLCADFEQALAAV